MNTKRSPVLLNFAFVALLIQPQQESGDFIKMPNSRGHWEKAGFVEMVSTLRLPTDPRGNDIIKVWLKLPEKEQITVHLINDSKKDRYTLVYPPGTYADRVEFDKPERGISDVRGSYIDENGKTQFHVFRVPPIGPYDWLQGYQWPRTDDATDMAMGKKLVSLYFDGHSDEVKNHFLRHNHCLKCHVENSPVPQTVDEFKRHKSDSRGFFQISAVLDETMTVRNHRTWDLNADDPFVSVWCNNEIIKATVRDAKRFYECPNREFPVGKLDIPRALEVKDPHALKVCASRKYLFDHMDQKARNAFRKAFQECAKYEGEAK